MALTKKDLLEKAKRKEFWRIIETQNPRLYRALKLAGGNECRLLAICASALVALVMKKSGNRLAKKRKLNAWTIFVGEHLKLGKTMKEIAELWKNR